MFESISSLFYKNRDIFSQSDDDIGYTTTVKHRIRLTVEQQNSQTYRRITSSQYVKVKKHIRKLVGNNIIRESTSPFASPIVLVRKRYISLRLCVDCRKLYSKTHAGAFPLTRVEESFDALNGAKYFSLMDLISGYNQVHVAVEEDGISKTAFTTSMGIY